MWKVGLFKSSQDFPPWEEIHCSIFFGVTQIRFISSHEGRKPQCHAGASFKKSLFSHKMPRLFASPISLSFFAKKTATSHSHLKGVFGGNGVLLCCLTHGLVTHKKDVILLLVFLVWYRSSPSIDYLQVNSAFKHHSSVFCSLVCFFFLGNRS